MSELVIVSAADEAALVSEMTRVSGYLARVPGANLTDVAYTCALTRGPCAITFVADDIADLRARLDSAGARLKSGSLRRIRDKSGTYYFRERLLGEGRGQLAFLYPGVMGFYPDMMCDLAIGYPECRSAFDELEEAMVGVADFTPSSFVYPPAQYYRHDADIFRSGGYAQALVATYAACAALTRLLGYIGIAPDGVVGFAGGDLAAMVRSGAAGTDAPRTDRVAILRDIYGIVDKAVRHGGLPEVAMVTALPRRPEDLEAVLATLSPDEVRLAVDFSPRQKTFAVRPDSAERVLAAFAAGGVRAIRLALDRPFNTPMCASLVPAIRKFAVRWMTHEPTCDIYSCATASRLPSGLKAAREDTAGRWASQVRFTETVRRMHAEGYRVFVEVGPRGLLTTAVDDTLRGEPHAALALNSTHRSGIAQMQHALAQLAALGASQLDVTPDFVRRKARRLDFDSQFPVGVRRDAESPLSRRFPTLTLLAAAARPGGESVLTAPSKRGARAVARAAAIAQQARRQRQFDFGAINPLVSDADPVDSSPGVFTEIVKTFKIADLPFIGDFALGTSQMSYADPNLKGLVTLTLPLGAEIMAETASLVVPGGGLVRIEDLQSRRLVAFARGQLALVMRAERVASAHPEEAAVRVTVREQGGEAAYTRPILEGTFVFTAAGRAVAPAEIEPMIRPRGVHWSGREIYPARLCCGKRLRGIQFVEDWSESGLDYDVVVPPLADNVAFTRFPAWVVNPVLLGAVTNGFVLWRSHERFAGAFAFPFRLRRLELAGRVPEEGATLKCYLRLTGVTPKSQICDILATDGNGTKLFSVSGWEEFTERVPSGYRNLIMQPAMTFLSETLSREMLGEPATDVASAVLTDIPYPIFERNEEIWLKAISHVVLNASERRDFADMAGSTSRRTEWLFGRLAAKEAVRRFLKEFYQARWSDADVQIWADDSGKPHALGSWQEYLPDRLDIAIAHTSDFVVAIAADHARVGVDVERAARPLSEEFTAGVFTPEEQQLVAEATNPVLAVIRFWCAKEAVSKALGTGIRYSPRELVVTNYEPDAGRLEIRLEGAWLEAFKNFRGRDVSVTVRTLREHVLAFCYIPATLFET